MTPPFLGIMRVAVVTLTADDRQRAETVALSVEDWRQGRQYALGRISDLLERACVSCEQEAIKARTAGPKGRLP